MRGWMGLACLLFGTALWAADEDRFALVIGNAAYEGESALANPVNDASDMADALASVGWKVTKLLNGDRGDMLKAIDGFHGALEDAKGATAILYYAGHGIQINGQNFLIPVRETIESANDVKNNAVALQDIIDGFEDAGVSTHIVIMDACRDNPFGKKNSRSLGSSRGLSVVSKPANVEGSAVLFATAPGETAADGGGRNGVFTQALLKYIPTDLKLQDLVTKVTAEVKTVTGGKQVPYNSLSLSDDFYLVPASLRTGTSGPVVANAVATLTVPGSGSGAPKGGGELWTWAGWLGTGSGVMAGGVAVWAYLAGSAAYQTYQSTTDSQTLPGLREKTKGYATIYSASAAAAGTLLASGIAALVFAPR